MDVDGLNASPIGQLVPIQGHDARHGDFAYFAFLPDPLPGDLVLQSATWTAVTEATAALAKLDQACQQLPDPRVLILPSLWREALDTSALEGTVAVLQELLEARLTNAGRFVSAEAREVRAYEQMALGAFSLVENRPISIGMLADLQAELFAATVPPPQDAGSVRQDVVWIGERDRPIQDSRFVPPPGDDRLRAGIGAWEAWIGAEHSHLPPVLRAAVGHYQFETLHPFSDGNGRIGRLVIVLQLLRGEAIRYPAVTVSPWFLRRRDEYQDQLLGMSRTGNWDPWIRFFSQAIREQSYSLIAGANALMAWLDESRRKLNERRWTGRIHQLLMDLIELPVITIGETANRYKVTPAAATNMVSHLVEIGVLTEVTGKSYARIFGASEIMRIVDSI